MTQPARPPPALLAHQGLRPTTAGGHIAVVEAITAKFPGVAGLKSLDRLRRRRNQAEYPDPAGYDAITPEEATEALDAARATTSDARRLLDAPQLGVFYRSRRGPGAEAVIPRGAHGHRFDALDLAFDGPR